MNLLIEGKEDIVRKRLLEMDMSKHISNTTLLDTNEKYERLSATVTGLKECMDTLAEAVSASSNIPICLLLGRSQGGLSDADGAQVRFYYDHIGGEQEVNVLPQLHQLVRYLNIANNNCLGDDVEIEANPLHQPTEQERATTRKVEMDTAVEAVNAGILMPEEVAYSFYGSDHYCSEIKLSDEHRAEIEQLGFTPEASNTSSERKENNGKTATNSFGKTNDMNYLGNLKTTDLKNLAKTFLPQNRINK
jgi:phage-related protein (TIGR01555 family)